MTNPPIALAELIASPAAAAAQIEKAIDVAEYRQRARLLPGGAAETFVALVRAGLEAVASLDVEIDSLEVRVSSAVPVANAYRGRPSCTSVCLTRGQITIARAEQTSADITGADVARIVCTKKHTPDLAARAIGAGYSVARGWAVLSR